jgi:hypothetical protein
MRLSAREKQLVGITGLVGLAIVAYMLLAPMVEAVVKNNEAKTNLSTEVTGLHTSVNNINTELSFYENKLKTPPDVNIQRYQGEAKQAALKVLVDELVHKLTATGGDLISLAPYEVVQPNVTLEKPTVAPAAATDPNAAATATAPATTPPPTAPATTPPTDPAALAAADTAPKSPVSAGGYEFQMRGSYAQVNQFIQSVRQNEHAVEIDTLQLVNEAGPIREDAPTEGTASKLDPNRPIKLTAKLKLFLMPETTVKL